MTIANLLQWTMPDEELVRRVLAGDVHAWAPLAHRHNQRLYRVCRSIVADAAEAEESLQDAYVRAYRQLPQFRSDTPFVTWLTKVAVFEALARRQPRQFARPKLVHRQRNAERRPQPVDTVLALEEAIDSLPPNLRTVFVLRQVQQLSAEETGSCLLLRQETVEARLQHADRILEKRLPAPLRAQTVDQVFFLKGTKSAALTELIMDRISQRADQQHFAEPQAKVR